MKNILLIVSILLFSLNGFSQKKEKTYKVLAACGPCQFDMKSPNGCSLAIQIAGKHYWVEGSTLADHGNEHSDNGMCNTTRKAKVTGKLEGDKIVASNFILIEK